MKWLNASKDGVIFFNKARTLGSIAVKSKHPAVLIGAAVGVGVLCTLGIGVAIGKKLSGNGSKK